MGITMHCTKTNKIIMDNIKLVPLMAGHAVCFNINNKDIILTWND